MDFIFQKFSIRGPNWRIVFTANNKGNLYCCCSSFKNADPTNEHAAAYLNYSSYVKTGQLIWTIRGMLKRDSLLTLKAFQGGEKWRVRENEGRPEKLMILFGKISSVILFFLFLIIRKQEKKYYKMKPRWVCKIT